MIRNERTYASIVAPVDGRHCRVINSFISADISSGRGTRSHARRFHKVADVAWVRRTVTANDFKQGSS
jgi:hypothetical protein